MTLTEALKGVGMQEYQVVTSKAYVRLYEGDSVHRLTFMVVEGLVTDFNCETATRKGPRVASYPEYTADRYHPSQVVGRGLIPFTAWLHRLEELEAVGIHILLGDGYGRGYGRGYLSDLYWLHKAFNTSHR